MNFSEHNMESTREHNKNHRAGTKRTGAVEPVRLLQLSAAGERFLGYICRDTACRVRRFHITKHSGKHASPERGGGPPLGGGEVFSCNLLCNVLEYIFDICGDPSVSAAHCQLLPSGPFCHFVTFPHSMGNHPFQGSLICYALCFPITEISVFLKIDLHGTKSQINHKDQSITTTTPKGKKAEAPP